MTNNNNYFTTQELVAGRVAAAREALERITTLQSELERALLEPDREAIQAANHRLNSALDEVELIDRAFVRGIAQALNRALHL